MAAMRIVDTLARGRETNPSLYALAYFCSEHFSPRRDVFIITLLLQLIDQHRGFDTVLPTKCRDAVLNAPLEPTQRDVGGFCDLLQ